MNVGGSHVIRMDYTTHTVDSEELITVIMHTSRSIVAPLWCTYIIIPTHCAASASEPCEDKDCL